MRIISASVTNFASYKDLDFDYSGQGLTLLQGLTGSGKSTLCDVVPWILFGRTAKDGTVDEIRSWGEDDITTGCISVDTGHEDTLIIYRSRGDKAKGNDLWYKDDPDLPEIRGRDITDTQRLINNLIGMDHNLYLSGAYYHEFSQTAQFFTTTAKNRRTICEQIVDLSLAQKLQPKLSEELKEINKYLYDFTTKVQMLQNDISTLIRVQQSENSKAETWEKTRALKKQSLIGSHDLFESERKKVISKKCNSCGTILEHPREAINTSENPYISRLVELEIEKNPHDKGVKDYSDDIASKKAQIIAAEAEVAFYTLESDDIKLLQDVVNDYRSSSITNTIQQLEEMTNSLLSTHFDAECKVNFTVADADKLDVLIYKDGHECSYTQLSKGQRCLLKLCFGVSVMKCVANHHGINFSQLFFDEALSGLDDNLKVKAHGLFEALALDYESVFVVEHSTEFKAMSNNSYCVQLINGNSVIEKA